MKRICFVNSKTETYVTCARILEHRIAWKLKVKSLSPPGAMTCVYQNTNLNIEIYVRFDGYNNDVGKKRKYTFIYVNAGKRRYSYKFTIGTFGGLECNNSDAQSAFSDAKYYKLKKEWVTRAEEIKEPNHSIQIAHYETVERVYDNIADDWGHDEVISSSDIYVTYVGNNPQNGNRQYVFSWNDNSSKMKFEIIGEW